MTKLVRVVAAVALAVCVTGVGTAGAAISTAAFCAGVQPGSSGFNDIASVAAAQRADIECLAASGITSGTAPNTYSPQGTVFRDSMATFVAKLVDTANALERVALESLPTQPGDAFGDDEQTVHEANINRLAAAGIVRGKGPGTYGPNGPGNEVTRGQMATFLVAAIDFMRPSNLAAAPDAFTDDNGSTHEANINRLAAIDVVDGVGGTNYNPDGTVSRAQMASFLIRTLAFLHAQNEIRALGPQVFAVTPSDPQTNPTDAAAGGEVTVTATQITVADVDIALFPCENVTIGQTTSFADGNPDDNVADPGGDLVQADIVSVNGTAQAADTESVNAAPVTNGTITFLVDSPSPDCVVAVVWDDADDDNGLDVSATGIPTERFGRSNTITFVPPPAASGAMDEDVLSHTRNGASGGSFGGCEIGGTGGGAAPEQGPNAPSTTDCFTFTYDNSDAFRLDPDQQGPSPQTLLSFEEFQARLSPGDDVGGTYDANPAGQSTFVLTDESPATPGGVTATAVDGDTITVTFNEVSPSDSYRVFRQQGATCPAFSTTGEGAYAQVGTVPGGAADADAGTTNTFTDEGLTPGTRYCYAVVAVDDGDESPPSTIVSATTPSGPPIALDTELTADGATVGTLDTGDVIQICFDQDIADPGDGSVISPDNETIRVRGANGVEVDLVNGTNATYSRGPATVGVTGGTATACAANRVLQVQLTANTTVTVPATITAAARIQDLDGQEFAPAGDPDVVIDVETGAEPS
jgi:hypothetical protein